MTDAIRTHSLAKFYDGQAALRGLDWSVAPGTAWGLLGPNGAGKSTTLRMLMGFTPPSSGSAEVLGEDCGAMTPATRARLGYVAEHPLLPGWLRVDDLVQFHGSFYPRWDAGRAAELLDLLALPRRARVATLSKGQNRRLMLVLALCQGADLLLLDEPGSGLDVAARRRLLSLLGDFLGESEERTLVLSSHIVTDVERIVSHVAILAHGRLVEAAPLDELHEQVRRVRMPRALWDGSVAAWQAAGILQSEASGATQTLTVRNLDAVPAELAQQAAVEVMPLGLEDIFLAVTEAADRRAPAPAGLEPSTRPEQREVAS